MDNTNELRISFCRKKSSPSALLAVIYGQALILCDSYRKVRCQGSAGLRDQQSSFWIFVVDLQKKRGIFREGKALKETREERSRLEGSHRRMENNSCIINMLTLWKQLPSSPVWFSGSSLLAAVSMRTPRWQRWQWKPDWAGRRLAKVSVQTTLPVPSTEEVARLQRAWGLRASRKRRTLSGSFVFGEKHTDTDENTPLEKQLRR